MLTRDIISSIPSSPGVYIFKNRQSTILYVGKAKNLSKRVSQYFSPGSVRKQDMMAHATHLEHIVTQTEAEALYLEENLIKNHLPEYNRLLKNNSQYVYIKITADRFPQIFVTKQKRNDRSTYIGPKYNAHILRKTIQYCKSYLKWRGCKNFQFRQKSLCTEYFFGQCAGWCVANDPATMARHSIDPDTISQKASENIMRTIRQFFGGRPQYLQGMLMNDITTAIAQQNFEWAAQLRDMYRGIENFSEKQSVVFAQRIDCIVGTTIRLGNYTILCLLNIVEGKIIDIVRQSYPVDDVSMTSIWAMVAAEYGESFVLYDDQKNIVSDYSERDDMTMRGLAVADKRHTLPSLLEKVGEVIDNAVSSFLVQESSPAIPLMNDILSLLQMQLGLDSFPYEIEAVDVSHIDGSWTAGGISCLVGGVSFPPRYRQYKLAGNDDYHNLSIIVAKRFQLLYPAGGIAEADHAKKSPLTVPNVFLIDGGLGQLHAIQSLIDANAGRRDRYPDLSIVAVSKGEARKTTRIGQKSTKKIQGSDIGELFLVLRRDGRIDRYDCTYSSAEKLLLRARDEAHRFANRYRKKQMSMEWRE